MVKSEALFRLVVARVIAFLHSKNPFLLLKLPTGSGKTTNAINTVNDFAEKCWIYLSPFHKNITENLEMSPHRHDKLKYIHMKSRAKSCIVPQFRELAQKHINIRPICENKCEKKEEDCPYYEAKRELFNNPQNWAGVHAHINEFLGDFLYSLDPNEIPNHQYYDILIIDENPISVLFINEKGNAETLADLKNVLAKLNLQTEDARMCDKFLEFLILSFLSDKRINYKKLYELFTPIDFRLLYEQYQVEIIDRIIAGQMDVLEIPKDYLVWFDRIQRHASRKKIENMIVKKEASGYTKKSYYFMCFEETVLHNLPFKIIGLDGTANLDIWRAIIGEEPSLFYVPYEYHNMYQLVDGEYPLSSWLEPNIFKLRSTGERLCDIIDLVAERKKNKVLVCSTQSLKPHIRQQCKANNLIFGYYYYLRSRNDFYQTADTVILACQPNIPEFQLECFTNLSSWGSEVWRQVFTDEEMVQAVGRIRFDLAEVKETKRIRERREIYIFPSKGGNENPFDNWSEKWHYSDMKYFAIYGKKPAERVDIGVGYMANLVPEEGIYSSNLLTLFKKTSGEKGEYVNQVYRELKKRAGLEIVKRRKIYPRMVETIKRK